MVKDDIKTVPHAHYMHPLDGIRGVACLFVVASHVLVALRAELPGTPVDLGLAGVLIFFVLSSFLMTTIYLRQPVTPAALEKYAIARFARIAPAYWLAVLVAWACYLVIPGFGYDMNPLMVARAFGFLGSVGVFWSIPPEVQFYIFFAFSWFAVAAYRQGNKLWAFAAAVAFIGAALTNSYWPGILLPSKLHIFGAGFFGALLVQNTSIRAVMCRPLLQAALIVAAFTYWNTVTLYDMKYHDLFFAAFVGLTVASLSASTIVTKCFETSAMRIIGAASFSIYLLHDMVI